MERLRLDKASAAYGHWVGRLVQALMMTRRHNAEAREFAVRTVRTLCTPRSPADYAAAVRGECLRDLEEIRRWASEWRDQFACGSQRAAKSAF